MTPSRQQSLRQIYVEAFDSVSHPEFDAETWADRILQVEPAGMFGSLAMLADANNRPLLAAHELSAVMREMSRHGLL